MIPSIYQIISAPLTVLGARIYPFGSAPQGVTAPYAVWQLISGTAENCINQTPVIDRWTVQFDVYGANSADVLAASSELRQAVEPHGHVVSYGGASRDPGTGLRRITFDADLWLSR